MTIDWSTAGLRASSVSTEVAAYLENLIRTGHVMPGDKLPPEREIAVQLGVSRASVRQAMHELTLKGLTDRKPGRGTVVVHRTGSQVSSLLGALNQTDRELLETADLRQVIEPSVAERAAERATLADIRHLDESLSKATANLRPTESARLDEEFHMLLAHATQNPLLVTLVDLMRDWLSDVRSESHATKAGRAASLAGHRRILDAIKAGDSTQAAAAMRDHIEDIAELVRERSTKR